jgi:ABC-2 type transport system ATP-binding protein
MNASHGFMILQSDNNTALISALEEMRVFTNIKQDGEVIISYLKEPTDASAVNKELFDKGIVLSQLEKRKESLEEQFLEITKNN